MKKRTRTLVLGLVLFALALLFLGTIRLQDGLMHQQSEREHAETHCRIAVMAWGKGIASEKDRQAWRKAVRENPELYLLAGCGDLRLLTDTDE
ncbi:MAG: hypothetical protein IKB16_14395 [Lentisphaeria bacterium]|nr:hypothetical protein [Lentisphaeria bacterium]